jgi:hypothetical protein
MTRPREGEVAVVVPVYRPGLNADERVSLRHLERVLGGYDRFLVMPESLRFGLDGFGVKRFPDRFLESRRGYSALMLSRRFYSTFAAYDYVLIYQLDCLVFRDELHYWCEQDYDYIGAMHKIGDRSLPGNGGFSLRRISSFLNVLNSKTRTVDPGEHWQRHWSQRAPLRRGLNLPRRYAKHLHSFNGVGWEIHRMNRAYHGWAEDWFWSLNAQKYWPRFRIAPNEQGLRFAFAESPEEWFELAGRQLPFGCHGWNGVARAFWEAYVLP